ncbi:restriction endonuclease subunit S [Vibrio kanaloae]|uniref:restriction endonuclease subunit S n=1 Tax=Vibrio kanaloae TaxID=170673 RepID=UPI0010BF58F9|nr:restriction endonuclease subunit S [Vibrio kanaloae]TKF18856.1 restriction endonuclease subunit S [Vibrio kanaloae]
MRSNYKKLGQFIREVSVKNKDLSVELLLGVSITKQFIPSIANTVGTDMSNYKVVEHHQFAYGPVTSRNGEKISVALLGEEKCIVSTSYTVFEIVDTELLDPEYLMMWFRRSEFDRYARYMSHGTVRELFGWQEMCDIELPVPSIEKQREIVREYNVVNDRIALNEQLTKKLEDTAQAIYKQWFVDFEFPISKEYAESIGKPELEGKPYKSSGGEMKYSEQFDQEIPLSWEHSTLEKCTSYLSRGLAPKYTEENGCLVLNQKCIRNSAINFELARRHDFTKKKTLDERYLKLNDVVVNSTGQGTLGRVAVVKYLPERVIVDTHVTILRPNKELIPSYFWFNICSRETEIENLAEGSTGQTELKRDYLYELSILKPSETVQREFDRLVQPILHKLILIEKKTPKIVELKSILLQRLSKV